MDINPKGNVPALKLEDGTLLNEGAATLQYIADQAPASGLAPAAGTSARYLLINALNFLASEVHVAGFGPLFRAKTPEAKAEGAANLAPKLALAAALPQVTSEAVDVASLYLYVILGWAGYVGVDLAPYPALVAFCARIGAHPVVEAANKEMAEAK